jgi:hypothetical protein
MIKDIDCNSTKGLNVVHMFNAACLPFNQSDEIYWGGLEKLSVYYGGRWHKLNVFSVAIRYTYEGTQFVLYRTRLGNFAFVSTSSTGPFVTLFRARTIPHFDYMWICLPHSECTANRRNEGRTQCSGTCRCGADDHCIERILYCCVICGKSVPGGGQLCDKTSCLMKHLL